MCSAVCVCGMNGIFLVPLFPHETICNLRNLKWTKLTVNVNGFLYTERKGNG